jgi:hypothetical protein
MERMNYKIVRQVLLVNVDLISHGLPDTVVEIPCFLA